MRIDYEKLLEYDREDLYKEHRFFDEEPLLECEHYVWQDFVLEALVKEHSANKIGGFYMNHDLEFNVVVLSNIVNSDLRLINDSGYISDNGSIPLDGGYVCVNRTIDIKFIWRYVKNKLNSIGIKYVEGNSDWAYNSLECNIVDYLLHLVNVRFLLDLNTRMGHDDEFSFMLSGRFLDILTDEGVF